MKPMPSNWRGKQDRMMSALMGDIVAGRGFQRLDALRASLPAQTLSSDTLKGGE
jgi:hypothetical protein